MGRNRIYKNKKTNNSQKSNKPTVKNNESNLPTNQSFTGAIGTGMGFGVGSAIAHKAVDGLFSGNSENIDKNKQHEEENHHAKTCQLFFNNLNTCFEKNNDINYCQNYIDVLNNMDCLKKVGDKNI